LGCAGRDDDQAAFASNVETGGKIAGAVANGLACGNLEQVMDAAAARLGGQCDGQVAVGGLKCFERLVTAVARVNVENKHSRVAAGEDADVHVWPCLEPVRPMLFSCIESILPFDAGMFAGAGAFIASCASTRAGYKAVERDRGKPFGAVVRDVV